MALILATVLLASCDESFAPNAVSDFQFSVFGYLDASADTQWIRVMPVRPLLPTSPDSFGATVTLEDLGTGRIITLRDSVFRYAHHQHPDIGSEGVYLHNFWTTERIEPGAIYRFSVERDGDPPAEAIVAIPTDYDVEVWLGQLQLDPDYLRLTGLKHAPFLEVHAYFYDRCGSSVETLSSEGGTADEELQILLPIEKADVPPRGDCGTPTVEGRELWVVGSQSEWPSGNMTSPGRLAVPDAPSNITNSLGFIGGVLTKVIPYENCEFQSEEPIGGHCRLRYDEASAALRGIVTETRCGDGVMDSATVQLREIEGDPAALRKVRSTLSNLAGEFEIRGLEPGMRYALTVLGKLAPDPFWGKIDVHDPHDDTLEFGPSEQMQYDVQLERFTPCESKP